MKVPTYKKTIPIILAGLVVLAGIYALCVVLDLGSLVDKFSGSKTSQVTSKSKLSGEQKATTNYDKKSNQATDDTLYYDNLPFFHGATELDRTLTEGDGVTASYQTPKGTTDQVLLDYFETELEQQGWKISSRDNNSKLEALSIDEVQLRLWIYFDGSDGSGVIYNVDFRIPGSEPWMPIPNQ